MKYAAAYVRMSDTDQDLSPERQWHEIETRATKDGFTILPACRYEDQGKSGWKKKTRRAGYDKMRRDLESGRLNDQGVTRVYFWKASRLARRRMEQLQAIMDFEEAGIEPISTSEAWPEDPTLRKALQTLIALFDELYSDNLSSDVKSGMKNQGRRGYWMHGHVPYGYLPVKASELDPPKLAPDPSTWPHLQRLLEMRLTDRDGHRKIAERLTVERIPPPTRKDLARTSRIDGWRAKHVREILGNLVYTGVIPWHPKDPKTGKRIRDTETGEEVVEILCENAHEALFTREQWEAERRLCKERLKKGTHRNPIRINERGLFTPWLRCGTCGSKIYIQIGGSRAKPLWYYHCGATLENREACTGISVRTDLLDPFILTAIEQELLSEAGVRRLVEASIEKLRATPDGQAAAERQRLEREDREVGQKIERLGALAEEGGDIDELRGRLTLLRAQRASLREELAAIPQPGVIPDPGDVDLGAFRERLAVIWSEKPVLDRRRALQEVLDHIVVHPSGEVAIHYAWKDPSADNIYQSPYGPP